MTKLSPKVFERAAEPIAGELIALGTDQETGLTRALVECTLGQLASLKYAPMYQPVVVVLADDFYALRDAAALICSEENLL